MTRQWVKPLVRFSVYVYFAAGMALLFSGGMASALRYAADKRVAAINLLIMFGIIFVMLAFGNWNSFQRPMSSRKWIVLCIVSSMGLLLLAFAPTSYGGAGA